MRWKQRFSFATTSVSSKDIHNRKPPVSLDWNNKILNESTAAVVLLVVSSRSAPSLAARLGGGTFDVFW